MITTNIKHDCLICKCETARKVELTRCTSGTDMYGESIMETYLIYYVCLGCGTMFQLINK